MKKIVALAALALTALSASAADNSWYVGADIGSTSFKWTGDSATKTGFGGLVGYTLNQNVAFEGSVRRLGSQNGVNVDAWQASALGLLPLNQQFTVYGRLGATRNSVSETTNNVTVSANKTRALIGVGVDYKIDKSWALRAEYNDLGDNDNVRINQFNVGATYSF